MAPYHHHVNMHSKSKRARKLKKVSRAVLSFAVLAILVVGVDWFLGTLRSETKVSKESNATVQSAQINIFQSPYFRFQADSNWREVTDEANLSSSGSTKEYLYRRFQKNFIEHEIYITVNQTDSSKIARHNIPTRIIPVRVEIDGSLSQLNGISPPCVEALKDGDTNLQPHVVNQSSIDYFCFPNEENSYVVTVGVPGESNELTYLGPDRIANTVTVVYRNITPLPDSQIFERIIGNFKLL